MTSDSALLPVAEADATGPDDTLMMDVLASQYRLSAVAVADRLGLFAALAEAPSSAAALASDRALHPHGTAVLLNALAAQGLLVVHAGAYHPTATARSFLLPGTARHWGPMLGLGWDERCTAVRTLVTEGTPFGYRGKGIWDTHNRSRHHGELFARAMHAHSAGPAAALASRLELGDCTSLLEVGGGVGTYSLALAGRNPRLTAQVLDLPVVERLALRLIEDSGLTGRVRLRAGDMFGDPWPGEQDRVLFADVLSDWDDEGCRTLLGRARKALAPDGRLLIHQVLLDDSRHGSDSAAGYSLALAVMTGGRLRTLPELASLLAQSGFGACVTTPAYGHYSLITVRPD
ncbi:methyltransferase [Streptomyces sp. FL06-04B]|uniref:methyltransferase n=1 Tax=unclassified Streptomyces TaxID=2593676 RepID=UPI0029BA9F41|nr:MULTISPECIES: methyltransferase [unclassified Streptomyces]MDX3605492.1 methyltransferase [Streptomyces sp. FL06-04B]MDX3736428.1 methyltransferase [Streptomyces sp. ID01-15D]